MKRWFKLLGVELRKIHSRKTSYVLAIALISIAILTVGVKHYVAEFIADQTAQYEETGDSFGITIDGMFNEPEITPSRLQSRHAELERRIEMGKMVPGYDERSSGAQSMRNDLIVMEGYMERDAVPITQENNLFRELSSNTPFNNLLIILTVVLALSIAGEYSSGTMKQMFIRPYTRAQILTTKYVAAMIYGLALVILNYIVYFVAHGLVFGFQTDNNLLVIAVNGESVGMSAMLHSVLMHLFTWLSVAMILGLVTLIAVLTRSQGATIGLTIALGVIAPALMTALSGFIHWFSVLPFAFMDLRPTLTAGLNAFSMESSFISSPTGLSYGLTSTTVWLGWLVYLLVFMTAATLIFRKRDV